MKDNFGRSIDYLRMSVTDRCNLRCRYCMPQQGVSQSSHHEILRFEEMAGFAKVCGQNGIENIRITGGEPLVRKGIASLIAMLKETAGIKKVTMTTNGILLEQYLGDLLEAGLDGVNISLDTLDRQKYQDITGYDGLADVRRAIEKSIQAGHKVKVNMVTAKGLNHQEIADMALLAKDASVDVRYIEMMPMGLGAGFETLSRQEAMKILEETLDAHLAEDNGNRGDCGPAQYFRIEGFKGRLGFISPMTCKFCHSCNRLRLTSQGILRPCLQSQQGVDIKKALRQEGHNELSINGHESQSGSLDQLLEELLQKAIMAKPAGHSFGADSLGLESHTSQPKSMWQIGG